MVIIGGTWAARVAHPDSSEAKQGAAVLLKGENIDIAGDI